VVTSALGQHKTIDLDKVQITAPADDNGYEPIAPPSLDGSNPAAPGNASSPSAEEDPSAALMRSLQSDGSASSPRK
jgi:hypothetical protein